MSLSHQLNLLLPDIVRDSRLETEITSAYTQHVYYESGLSARERQVRKEERWVRDRFLGQGAYGTVYLERCAPDENTTKLRAVKEIKKHIVGGKEQEYTRELEAIMKFSHARYSHCFVRSYGWFENEDSIFIAMEYLGSGDLQKYLTKPLPETEAKIITSQVLEGLKFMHENGFVHRDLKPGNIMVVTKGPDWFVKIADFGISKRRHQDVTSLHTLQRGTLGFAAPEVMGLRLDDNSRSYTAAVDMWSLGAVTYIILTNMTPFPTYFDLFQFSVGMLKFPHERLQALSITEHGQDFIIALMSPNPSVRLSSTLAERHPWISLHSTISTNNVETHGHTMISTASVAWSFVTEQFEAETIRSERKGIEEHSEAEIENEAKKTVIPRLLSPYRSPYFEDCVDESENSKTALAPNSPYVFEEASNPATTPVTGSPPSHLNLTPPLTPQNNTPALRPGPKVSISTSNASPKETLLPPFATRPKTLESSQAGQKRGVNGEIRTNSSKSFGDNGAGLGLQDSRKHRNSSNHRGSASVGDMSLPSAPENVSAANTTDNDWTVSKESQDVNELSNDSESGTSDDLTTEHESVSRYNEVKVYRDSLTRNSTQLDLGDAGTHLYKAGIRGMLCAYCKVPHDIIYGQIERVLCGHWICHYCLVERFALALVSRDYKLKCCGTDIHLQAFRRILVDPAVNQLWTSGYVRKDHKPGPDDGFIDFLLRKNVFIDPGIKLELQVVAGIVFPVTEPDKSQETPPSVPPTASSSRRRYGQYPYCIDKSASQSEPDESYSDSDWETSESSDYPSVAGERRQTEDLIVHSNGRPGRDRAIGFSKSDIVRWRRGITGRSDQNLLYPRNEPVPFLR